MYDVRSLIDTLIESNNTMYHGVSTADKAKYILANGITPPEPNGKHFTAPVVGRVYLTRDIGYALIYALGGNYAGNDPYRPFIERDGQYGYVFVVDLDDTNNIQPDEDSVGELLYNKKAPQWLVSLANRIVAPSRMRRVMDGEYIYFASVGKQLLKRMSDWQKKDILNLEYGHVSHAGVLRPKSMWRVDKAKSNLFSKDGSNFFDVAEEVHDVL